MNSSPSGHQLLYPPASLPVPKRLDAVPGLPMLTPACSAVCCTFSSAPPPIVSPTSQTWRGWMRSVEAQRQFRLSPPGRGDSRAQLWITLAGQIPKHSRRSQEHEQWIPATESCTNGFPLVLLPPSSVSQRGKLPLLHPPPLPTQ